ncbi:uncharacterized protein LOC115891500, partial [Sitophilus oryzae]|uniref:Uncharacterized protein LOC115891500 n=1 Tax=Sitophilus oryzae TaxID=7048 RepID=A0A6J2YUM5_SITOR
GDLGGITLQILSALYPKSVLGYHTNFPVVYTLKSYIKPILGVLYPSWIVKPEHYERVYPLKDRGLFIFRESGYFHLQSTKPDSLGVAMDNSPEGMAAYFLEKFITGSNFTYINKFSSKDLKEKFSFTGLIDNLMLYWVTQTASSSFRMYFESFEDGFWTDSIALMRKIKEITGENKNNTLTSIKNRQGTTILDINELNDTWKNYAEALFWDQRTHKPANNFGNMEGPKILESEVRYSIDCLKNRKVQVMMIYMLEVLKQTDIKQLTYLFNVIYDSDKSHRTGQSPRLSPSQRKQIQNCGDHRLHKLSNESRT